MTGSPRIGTPAPRIRASGSSTNWAWTPSSGDFGPQADRSAVHHETNRDVQGSSQASTTWNQGCEARASGWLTASRLVVRRPIFHRCPLPKSMPTWLGSILRSAAPSRSCAAPSCRSSPMPNRGSLMACRRSKWVANLCLDSPPTRSTSATSPTAARSSPS